MKNRSYFKKIAAIIMAAALAVPAHAVFAEDVAETETVVVCEAPVTEAPATEAPATEAPATEAPATEAPATEAPATEAPVTEAPATEAPATEVPETEAPATEEITETDTEDAETETTVATEEAEDTETESESESESETETESETENYATELTFENEEVKIIAYISEEAKLPETAELKATKLEEGSAAFEEAKAASMRDLGTAEEAEYKFYDVTFVVDGEKVELPERAASIKAEFKNVETDESVVRQSALHIEDTSNGKNAQDVTATAEEGNIRSVDFTV